MTTTLGNQLSFDVNAFSAQQETVEPRLNMASPLQQETIEPRLVNTHPGVDIELHSNSEKPPEPVPTAATKDPDKPLFYDYLIHCKLEVGETLILYRDGHFEKEGKHNRK